MRMYRDFPEALNEIRRELKEMGIKVHTKSVQNKSIVDNADYSSLEIQNYTYTVTSPDYSDIPLRSQGWAQSEFQERTSGLPLNPGSAWKIREEYWKNYLDSYGRFDYAYPERMSTPLKEVIEALRADISTRRAYLGVFQPGHDIPYAFGHRIPCTIGYWFNYRHEQLNITYLQRSSDFSEHFNYDIYLADRLKCFVAESVGVKPGMFTHWLGSLHCFQKDVQNVF